MTIRQLAHRAGRRGAALLTLALLDFAYGSGLLIGHSPAATLATYLASGRTWGYVWVTVGALLLTGIPASADRLQFAFAALFKAFWALMLLAYEIPQPGHGHFASAAPWLALVAFVVLTSSWPEDHHG